MFAVYAEPRIPTLALLALFVLAGCAQDDPTPATQVVVTVSGDADVLAQLARIEARIYRTEAVADPKPVATHQFKLPATMPLSFGVVHSDARRFLLVLEGHGAEEGRPPLIERKVRAEFTDAATMQLDVQLASECLRMPSPCGDLEHTCRADVRACGDVALVPMRETKADALLTPEASVRPEVAEACRDVACPDGYPCTPTLGGGHVCLGQFADWPVPDATPGAQHPPKYDLSTEGVVRDEVTGMVWQRESPKKYESCRSRNVNSAVIGSGCSWDEAKAYCADLKLDGRAWRLPSKVELESIVDPLAETAFAPELFSGCADSFWTSTLAVSTAAREVQLAIPIFDTGTEGFSPVTSALCVRCVSGHPTGATTPETRYAVEADQTVHDLHTGLRWQRTLSAPFATVEEASSHCSAAGNGFRLPNLKELLTLVDPTRYFPSIHPIFPDIEAVRVWAAPASTSTAAGKAVEFHAGTWGYDRLDAQLLPLEMLPPRARCVR